MKAVSQVKKQRARGRNERGAEEEMAGEEGGIEELTSLREVDDVSNEGGDI